MDKITAQYRYLATLLRFGFSEKPVLWVSALLAFVTSGLDILSMSLLYPLSMVAQNIPLNKSGFFFRHINPAYLSAKWLILFFLLFLGLRMAVNLVNQGIIQRVGKTLLAIMNSRIFGMVISDVPIAQLNSKGVGFYTSIAGDESNRASTAIINLSQLFNLLCMTGTYYVAIAVFSFKSFLFITFFLAVCFALMLTVFKKVHKLGVKQAEMSRIANMVFIDAINNVKSIRCYSGESFILGNYTKKIFDYVRIVFLGEYYQVILRSVPVILLIIFTAAFIAITMGADQRLDIPFLIALLAYLSRFFPSLGLCLNTTLKLISDAKSGKDVIGFLNDAQKAPKKKQAKSLEPIKEISFENIFFNYDEKKILVDFKYSFRAGESYAIIGPSGVGKSTLLDLLLKFYPAASGKIRVNNANLEDLSDSMVRDRIVLMEQRVTIFNESILMNITLGSEATLEQVREACRLAKIDAFIEGLPGGYQEVIQYMGANLSGGQRQRIALARAILRNPEVLILDESLTALDVATKEDIFTELKEMCKDKILISVSHDPWIVENSGVVLDFGNLK